MKSKKKDKIKSIFTLKIPAHARHEIDGVIQIHNGQSCAVEVRVKRLKKCIELIGLTILILLVSAQAYASIPSYLIKAESLIGQGETTGNNSGPFIRKIGKEGQPWCAYFVSYCLELKKPISNARGFLIYPKILKPQTGDLVIWSRGKDKKYGHIGIIESIYHDYFYSIEGNSGVFPSKVKLIKHNINDSTILAFVSGKMK